MCQQKRCVTGCRTLACPTPEDASDAEPSDAEPIDALDHEERVQDIELKGKYGKRLLALMIIQLGIADGVFIAYAWAGRSWDVPTASMQGFLAATLVEVIGVVLVVTRYLFPSR
jgi:hypothetical protein